MGKKSIVQYSASITLVVIVMLSYLVYPIYKTMLRGKDALGAVQILLPVFTVLVVLIVLAVVLPYLFVASKKKAEIRNKDVYERQVAYMDLIDPAVLDDDSLFESLDVPKRTEKSPLYKAPKDTLRDPYAPKPKGYAKKQTELGHPEAPALLPLKEPECD